MRGNNLNDLKNNINNAEDKNKTDSGEKIAPIGRNLCIALVALCVVNIIAHLACYSRLPENVPIHWDADGSVNSYGPRAVMLILDVLPLLCLGLFLVIPKMDPKGENYMKASGLYRGFVIAFTLIMCGAVRRLRQLPSAHAPELHFRHQNALGSGRREQLEAYAARGWHLFHGVGSAVDCGGCCQLCRACGRHAHGRNYCDDSGWCSARSLCIQLPVVPPQSRFAAKLK